MRSPLQAMNECRVAGKGRLSLPMADADAGKIRLSVSGGGSGPITPESVARAVAAAGVAQYGYAAELPVDDHAGQRHTINAHDAAVYLCERYGLDASILPSPDDAAVAKQQHNRFNGKPLVPSV